MLQTTLFLCTAKDRRLSYVHNTHFLDIRHPNVIQDTRDSALYFFQFPTPFPSFLPILSHSGRNHSESPDSVPMDIHSNRQDATVSTNPLADARHTLKRPKTVTFASETKAPMPVTEAEAPVLDGVIGQLDVYRSGAVKMRLGNGTVLEVGHSLTFSASPVRC